MVDRAGWHDDDVMLGAALDVFRMRQYFDVVTRAREFAGDLASDAGFLDALRRAMLPLPVDRRPPIVDPFPADPTHRPLRAWRGRRVGIAATGGSGALASVVGVGRAFEEAGITPAVISVCSGSALFGFPLAAGVPASKVARFVLGLRPQDYIDPDWLGIARIGPSLGRGFCGLLKGAQVEETYTELLGDMRLGDLPVPCYAPIWNVESNRIEFIGPSTRPDMTVARAVHMAIALPLFIDPVALDGGWWCDGGIVDIFPVHPILDLEGGCDAVVAVNGFYPTDFTGEDQTGWRSRRLSILYAASQVRTSQQAGLARENLARLRRESEVLMIEPVPYQTVQGLGFYRQFMDNRDWGSFMAAGRAAAWSALAARGAHPAAA